MEQSQHHRLSTTIINQYAKAPLLSEAECIFLATPIQGDRLMLQRRLDAARVGKSIIPDAVELVKRPYRGSIVEVQQFFFSVENFTSWLVSAGFSVSPLLFEINKARGLDCKTPTPAAPAAPQVAGRAELRAVDKPDPNVVAPACSDESTGAAVPAPLAVPTHTQPRDLDAAAREDVQPFNTPPIAVNVKEKL